MSTEPGKQLLHLVFGGELKSLTGIEFKDLAGLDIEDSQRNVRAGRWPGPRVARPSAHPP